MNRKQVPWFSGLCFLHYTRLNFVELHCTANHKLSWPLSQDCQTLAKTQPSSFSFLNNRPLLVLFRFCFITWYQLHPKRRDSYPWNCGSSSEQQDIIYAYLLQRQVNLLNVIKKKGGGLLHPPQESSLLWFPGQTNLFLPAGRAVLPSPSLIFRSSVITCYSLSFFLSLGIKIRNFLVPWNPIYCSASSVTIQNSSWIFKETCFQSLLLLICLHRCLEILLGFRGGLLCSSPSVQ